MLHALRTFATKGSPFGLMVSGPAGHGLAQITDNGKAFNAFFMGLPRAAYLLMKFATRQTVEDELSELAVECGDIHCQLTDDFGGQRAQSFLMAVKLGPIAQRTKNPYTRDELEFVSSVRHDAAILWQGLLPIVNHGNHRFANLIAWRQPGAGPKQGQTPATLEETVIIDNINTILLNWGVLSGGGLMDQSFVYRDPGELALEGLKRFRLLP